MAPSAQRIEVQDGASETMRNAVDCFEMWPEAIIRRIAKMGQRRREAEESGYLM